MGNTDLVKHMRSLYPRTDNPNAMPIYMDLHRVLDALESKESKPNEIASTPGGIR